MKDTLVYIADGKMYTEQDGRQIGIPSTVLCQYTERTAESAQKNEWKTSGEGARFTGAFVGNADTESRVAAIRSAVECVGEDRGDLIYSINIDGGVGIYRKHGFGTAPEGIVLSDSRSLYHSFDLYRGMLAVGAAYAGESHIGIMDLEEGHCRIYTEGRSYDSDPAFSRTEPHVVYFSSAGLPETTETPGEAPRGGAMSLPQIMTQMAEDNAAMAQRGPAALCRLDISTGALDEICSDGKYDYLHPQSTSDGALYYIRRPYTSARSGGASPFGCLADIFLFPFRMIAALFGAFNVFSVKYSGKALSKSAGVKQKDEAQMMIDGNLIHASKELKANRARGEKNPGMIPASWELRVRKSDGSDALVRRGVAAFTVTEDAVYCSNGSAILRCTPDGREERISSAVHVSRLAILSLKTD